MLSVLRVLGCARKESPLDEVRAETSVAGEGY